MTEYEILGKIPTGIKVAIYHDKQELGIFSVPAEQCQSKVMLETWLKKKVAPKIMQWNVPKMVLNIKGRQMLDMG